MNEEFFPCPSCRFLVFGEPPGSYEICDLCGWEDDHVQLANPAMGGGANKEKLVRKPVGRSSKIPCGCFRCRHHPPRSGLAAIATRGDRALAITREWACILLRRDGRCSVLLLGPGCSAITFWSSGPPPAALACQLTANVKPHMQAMSNAVVNDLLTELSSVLGFSMAARDSESFLALAKDIEGFTDRVFVVEGMDPRGDSALRENVRARVSRHLGSGD